LKPDPTIGEISVINFQMDIQEDMDYEKILDLAD
jgi:hypothetical protein